MKAIYIFIILGLMSNLVTNACAQSTMSEKEKLYLQVEKTIKELIPKDMEFIEMSIENNKIYLNVKIFKYSPIDHFIANCERHPGLDRPIVVKGNEFDWPKVVTLKIAFDPRSFP